MCFSTMTTTLLLVEDDRAVREALGAAMRAEGYRVIEAGDGESALDRFDLDRPDLVLLDIRLPDLSGFEVCRRLRERSVVPVIMVTAQDDTHDLVAGLEAGADDYVTKPVEPKALAARVRALLRRVGMNQRSSPAVQVGDLDIRESEGIVRRAGEPVDLTRTEFRLLCELARNVGQVLSREQLLEQVWGYDYFGDSRLVDAHVRRLRLKVEASPESPTHVVTVRGLGYKLTRT